MGWLSLPSQECGRMRSARAGLQGVRASLPNPQPQSGVKLYVSTVRPSRHPLPSTPRHPQKKLLRPGRVIAVAAALTDIPVAAVAAIT